MLPIASGIKYWTGPVPRRRAAHQEVFPRTVVVPHVDREIRVKIASRTEELEQAFRLLADNYRARGYEAPGQAPFRFTAHHALPGTVTFVAQHHRSVVATLSLVPDTHLLGLPMEGAYRSEIEVLRRRGCRLGEATGLADQGLSLREFVAVFKALIRLMIQFHLGQGGDTWAMAVHPRHMGWYCKQLGAVRLGERRPYPGAEGHPAEACYFDLEGMRINAPAMYHEMLGEMLPVSVLAPGRWSVEGVRHFGRRSTQLDPEELEALLGALDRHGCPPRWASSSLRPDRSARLRGHGAGAEVTGAGPSDRPRKP